MLKCLFFNANADQKPTEGLINDHGKVKDPEIGRPWAASEKGSTRVADDADNSGRRRRRERSGKREREGERGEGRKEGGKG